MRPWLLCASAVLALLGVATSASSAQTSGCLASVDRAHVVRASGRVSLVHRRSGDRVELVLLHVSRSALRVAIAGKRSCGVDLVRFEHRWKGTPYELHARLRSPAGS